MLVHKLLPLFALGLNLVLLGTAIAPDRRSARNIVFAYFAAAAAVWNLGVLGLRWATSAETALAWERVLHLGVIAIPALFYHYVLVFLDLQVRRPSLVIAYTLCVAFILASPTPAFMTGVVDTPWGFAPAAGVLYAPFLVYFQAYMVLGLALLVRSYRGLASSFKRNRALLVILGVLVSIAGGLVDFARFVFHWEWLYPPGIPSNAVFALALGVAIVRYRLMDVGVLAKRVLLYLLVSVALAPVLFAGLWALDQLLPIARPQQPTDAGDVLAPLTRQAFVLTAVSAVALPLLRKLEGALERLMFRRRHGVRDALVSLSRELAALLDLKPLAEMLVERLVSRIPAIHASLFVHDPETGRFAALADAGSESIDATRPDVVIDEVIARWLRTTRRTLVVEESTFRQPTRASVRDAVAMLERQRVALLVPLVLDGELTAVIALGEKLSGEIFDADEVELLETLASQAGIALRNSRLYADLRTQMEELRRMQDQLVQSAKLAAIGELAASVAHEVNNPLTVILGYAELLLHGAPADPSTIRRLQNIVTEANRAGKIVHDLLDFARRRQPEWRPLQVSEVVERALEILHTKIVRSRIDVQTLFEPALPPIRGDRDQLTQVVVNLVGNAVDAMPNGGRLVLQTAVRGTEDTGRAVAISVSDTGSGIPPESLTHIFEPFYTTKPEGRGTGLGLSVSHGIVHRHGGTIEVDSQIGEGTTIRVLLPLSPE